MKELNLFEMKSVEGGANSILIVSAVTAVISFISGILNGIANPKKCN